MRNFIVALVSFIASFFAISNVAFAACKNEVCFDNGRCVCFDSKCLSNVCTIFETQAHDGQTFCTKSVAVEQTMFDVYKKFMESLLTSDGKVVSVLTPAQQTMFMFYTNVMNASSGVQCRTTTGGTNQ